MHFTVINQTVSKVQCRKPFGLTSSGDGHLVLQEIDGLELFQLRSSITTSGYLIDELQFNNRFIPTPQYIPTVHAGQDFNIESQLEPLEVAELNLNTTLQPTPKWNESPFEYHTVSTAWSPPGLVQTNNCLLTVLTSSGSVTLWEKRDVWKEIFDVSSVVFEYLSSNQMLKTIPRNPKLYLDALRNNCNALQTTAVTWTETLFKIANENFSYLLLAQKNGQIFVVKVCSNKTYDETTNLSITYSFTGLRDINILHCIDANESKLTLSCGNAQGLLENIHVDILEDQSSKKVKNIWPEEDGIIIDKIVSFKRDDYFSIILVKKSYLVSINIDCDCNVLNKTFKNFRNHRITGINQFNEDSFLIGTLTGVMYKVKFAFDRDGNGIHCEEIKCSIDFKKWGLYNMWISHNKVFVILCLTPCVVMNKIRGRYTSKLVFCSMDSENCIEKLLKNKTGYLTDYSDCFELLRLENARTNACIDSWPLKIDNGLSSYQMKLRMWLNAIAFKVENMTFEFNNDHYLAVLHNHVQESLETIYVDSKAVDNFTLTTIRLYINFLNNYKGKYEKPLPKTLIENVLLKFDKQIPDVEIRCEWCDEKICFMFCPKGHPRQWCCVTLQDINTPECLYCPFCKHIAHIELFSRAPRCTFCDSFLQKQFFTKRSLSLKSNVNS